MAENVECPSCQHTWPDSEADLGLRHCSVCGAALVVSRRPVAWQYEAVTVTAVLPTPPSTGCSQASGNNVECPSCQHTWPAAEADLGLRHCSVCGAALEVTRVPVAWQYEAVVVPPTTPSRRGA